ncbi:hypothetical protein IV203_010569 [Nitzschia inconspicua]|uniref:Dirigent protein n=1 Tax=Nitzschia inconspicua TaxID=303405 RepID=A0A9K3PN74_9STRA|nr:hypothetical protein IV203_010569 [Nitzschia inconspicua]
MKVPSIILKIVFLAAFAVFMVKGYDLESPPLSITIQELQSPPGPRHSAGIVRVGRTPAARIEEGKQVGLIWFDNDLAVPSTGAPMGTQTGHCVEVSANSLLACYFRFDLDAAEGKGTITAEALFDLAVFPTADLTITGGTGDFLGIIGSGFTFPPENFDGTTFFYTLNYFLP